MYESPKKENWHGRIDAADGSSGLRWHQVVRVLNLSEPVRILADDNKKKIAFLGFCSDEGVRRNQGRTGAVKGPAAIRIALSNLAVHFIEEEIQLFDAGDVICTQGNLEGAQEQLALKVGLLLKNNIFPIVLGGGHEVVYGHYKGINSYLSELGEKKAAIINFDAHFDLREATKEATSGTPFRQILEENEDFQRNFPYLCMGIQEASNTQVLFETADRNQVQYILAENIRYGNIDRLSSQVSDFIKAHNTVYLTVDLDVFASPFAPGVSAPALNGVFPDVIIKLIRHILGSNKVISMDIAELNPDMDIDNRTAKLAATILYEVVKWKTQKL